MKVRVRVLFNVYKENGISTRLETAAWKDMKMPFPPMVGLELMVGEDDIPISQVVFDHRKQEYKAYCECYAESKEEVGEAVKRFVSEGWTHDPY